MTLFDPGDTIQFAPLQYSLIALIAGIMARFAVGPQHGNANTAMQQFKDVACIAYTFNQMGSALMGLLFQFMQCLAYVTRMLCRKIGLCDKRWFVNIQHEYLT